MSQMRNGSAEKIRHIHARIAGFLYLFLIVTYMAGQLTLSNIVGSGDFAETAQRVIASQQLYRLALASELITAVGTVLLAFALFQTLKSADKNLAQLALYWRLGDAFIGGVAITFSFMTLGLYTDPQYVDRFSTEQLQALLYFARHAHAVALDIATMFFGAGSTIFFYLFFSSRYIPRSIAAFGLFASFMVLLMPFADLIYPDYSDKIQFGGLPIFIGEIVTGLWLLCFGIQADRKPAA